MGYAVDAHIDAGAATAATADHTGFLNLWEKGLCSIVAVT